MSRRFVSKGDMIKSIFRDKPDEMDLSYEQIEYVVNSFLDTIVNHIKKGNKVVIKFFGTFNKSHHKARRYVTPTGQTGESAPAEKMIFTQSSIVAKELNN